MRTAWWTVSKEVTEGRVQFWAEVYTKDGETLHNTGFHTDPHSAINDAEAWMARNGITHGAEVGE